MPKPLPKSTSKEAINLFLEGLSTRKVADQIGISQSQVRRILVKNNIEGRSTRTDSELEKKICDRYNSGESSETIAKEMGMNGTTICRIVKRNGFEVRESIRNKRIFSANTRFFENIDTEEKAYFLGFLFADGNVDKRERGFTLTLKEDDIHILKTLQKLLYHDKGNHIKNYNGYPSLNFTSIETAADLIKHGCVPNKTFKLKFPYNSMEEPLYKHFVRGFLDGDGCIYTPEGDSVSLIITGQENFLSELQEIFFKYTDAEWHLRPSKTSFEIRIKKISGVKKSLNWLYNDANIFLKRKKESAINALKTCNTKLENSINYGTTNLFSYKGNKLRNDYIRSLSLDDRELVAQDLLKQLRDSGFPYEQYPSKFIEEDFNKLKNTPICFENKEVSINVFSGIKTSRHFFPQFYSVRAANRPSMVDAFYNDELLLKTLRNRLGITHKDVFNITGNMIRQGLRNSYSAFAASTFKPIIAKLIYESFAPENSITLDISAGFGHRLLGAFAGTKINKYIGIDPWKANIDSCNEMKKKFDFNAEFHCIGSENFCPENLIGQIDFCFSSPPFYDKEIYNNEESQAYNNSTKREFINSWWLNTAENVHKLLKPDSLFVINMDKELFENMMTKCNHMFILQDIYFVSNKRGHMASNSKDHFFIIKRI